MSNEAARTARELYVYFHAPVERASEVAIAVRNMQQCLCSTFPGLTVALLRRPDDGSGQDTWMETYAWANGRVDGTTHDELAHALAAEASVWQHLLHGPRHLEVFERCV
jgi:hypothetical protein